MTVSKCLFSLPFEANFSYTECYNNWVGKHQSCPICGDFNNYVLDEGNYIVNNTSGSTMPQDRDEYYAEVSYEEEEEVSENEDDETTEEDEDDHEDDKEALRLFKEQGIVSHILSSKKKKGKKSSMSATYNSSFRSFDKDFDHGLRQFHRILQVTSETTDIPLIEPPTEQDVEDLMLLDALRASLGITEEADTPKFRNVRMKLSTARKQGLDDSVVFENYEDIADPYTRLAPQTYDYPSYGDSWAYDTAAVPTGSSALLDWQLPMVDEVDDEEFLVVRRVAGRVLPMCSYEAWLLQEDDEDNETYGSAVQSFDSGADNAVDQFIDSWFSHEPQRTRPTSSVSGYPRTTAPCCSFANLVDRMVGFPVYSTTLPLLPEPALHCCTVYRTRDTETATEDDARTKLL